jgi:hypothetical protein
VRVGSQISRVIKFQRGVRQGPVMSVNRSVSCAVIACDGPPPRHCHRCCLYQASNTMPIYALSLHRPTMWCLIWKLSFLNQPPNSHQSSISLHVFNSLRNQASGPLMVTPGMCMRTVICLNLSRAMQTLTCPHTKNVGCTESACSENG